MVYSHKLWDNLVHKKMGRKREILKYFSLLIVLFTKFCKSMIFEEPANLCVFNEYYESVLKLNTFYFVMSFDLSQLIVREIIVNYAIPEDIKQTQLLYSILWPSLYLRALQLHLYACMQSLR